MQVRRPQCCEEDVTSKCNVICRLCGPPVLRLAAGRNECSWKASATLGEAWQNEGNRGSPTNPDFVAAVVQKCHSSYPNLNHRSENTNCGLTLRSSGSPPVIIRFAGQAPRRFRPLTSNVRPQRTHRASCKRSQEQMQFKLALVETIKATRRRVNAGS